MSKFVLRNLKNEKRRLEKEIQKIDKKIDKINNTVVIAEGIIELGTSVEFSKVFGKQSDQTAEYKVTLKVKYERYKSEIKCTMILNHDLLGYGVFVGETRCASDDEFDIATGMCIAENRAIQKVYGYMTEQLG